MQQNRCSGLGAAPEDGLAADVIERQAGQPEVARAQRQALVRGAGGGIEIVLGQLYGFGPAFAAAGADDQGGIGGGRGVARKRVVVNRPKRSIFQAAGVGMQGKIEAAALALVCFLNGGDFLGQAFGFIQQLQPAIDLSGSNQPRRLGGNGGEIVQMLGQAAYRLHKRRIIRRRWIARQLSRSRNARF